MKLYENPKFHFALTNVLIIVFNLLMVNHISVSTEDQFHRLVLVVLFALSGCHYKSMKVTEDKK